MSPTQDGRPTGGIDIFIIINYGGGQDPTKAHTCAPLRWQTSMILSILNYKNCHGCPHNSLSWRVHNSRWTEQDLCRKLRLPDNITCRPRKAERSQQLTIVT